MSAPISPHFICGLLPTGTRSRSSSDIRCARTRSRASIERVTDWQAELDWIRAAGQGGYILFENIGLGYGEIQDGLRREGLNVIGGGAYRCSS